jgi:hypothetical protein
MFGHHSNDGVRSCADVHRFSQYVAISCETPLPNVVTQQHDIGMIGDGFVWGKASPNEWLDTQQTKEIGAGCHR